MVWKCANGSTSELHFVQFDEREPSFRCCVFTHNMKPPLILQFQVLVFSKRLLRRKQPLDLDQLNKEDNIYVARLPLLIAWMVLHNFTPQISRI
ncbi:MAG: hypothetical protein ACI80P_001460 [Flavobacteriales bacterium]